MAAGGAGRAEAGGGGGRTVSRWQARLAAERQPAERYTAEAGAKRGE